MEGGGFYSVPTSPLRRYGMACDQPRIMPRSLADELELETRFFRKEDEVWTKSQRWELEPRRFSFYDDYSEGKFTPPASREVRHQLNVQRLSHLHTYKMTLKRSMSLSPPVSARSSSPSSMLWINQFKHNTWNDDFKHFEEALENIKKDEKEMTILLKRTLSIPQTRASNLQGSSPLSAGSKSKDIDATGSPHIGKPKGVLFAIRTRLVKSGKEKPPSPTFTAHPVRTRDGWSTFNALEGKAEHIKKFFSSSFMRTSNEDKQPEVISTRPKPTLRRTFSFRARSGEVSEIFEKSTFDKSAAFDKSATFPAPKVFNCLSNRGNYED